VEDLWAYVSQLAGRFRDAAPEGMTAVIDVEMMDGHTIRPTVVQTHATGAWVVAELAPPGSTDGWEIVFVRQDDIRRVHLGYESSAKHPLGFRVGDIEPPG
jgi:hypothetical protein